MNDRTTGQVAKERDISVRTLRYYDQLGLLRPSYKDEHGKRYYTEDDLFRLEKIVLLREIGLPLGEISRVLDQVSYREVLVAHHNHLQAQLTVIQSQLAHTNSFIHLLDIHEHLPWERVTDMIRQAKTATKKWMDYFGEEERALLQKTLPRLEQSDKITQQYASLVRRVEWCLSRGISPHSPEAASIASELLDLVQETFGGDEELASQFWEVRKLPAQETGLVPIAEDVLHFLEQSLEWIERQKPQER